MTAPAEQAAVQRQGGHGGAAGRRKGEARPSVDRPARVSLAAGRWPLVGRKEELALVAGMQATGEVAGVVVAGAAGVGKTRFAAEALQEAEAGGRKTGWATATQAAAVIPFGAVAHLLPGAGRLGPSPLDILRQARAALREAAGGAPLVLAVDDVQLLDAGSAALIHQLAVTGSAFAIVTLRPGEQPPDPIVALWKDGVCEYLELQPLARNEVEALLRRVLAGELDGGTLVRLWEASRGNVLFLRELVLAGLERGTLTYADRLWRWHGSIAASRRLSELVAARLGQLTAEEQELLEFVAVAEPVAPSALRARASPKLLEPLEQRGLLTRALDGRRVELRVAHPLYGEALRARVPPRRLTRIRRGMADLLQATGARRRGDLLRLATWRLASSGAAEPQLFLAAAGAAEATFDPQLAERLARAAIAADGGLPARHALAQALSAQGRFGEAETTLAELADAAETDPDRLQIARARVVNLHFGLRQSAEAEAVLDATAASVSEPAAHDELATLRAWQFYFSGRPLEAINAVAQILTRPLIDERLGVHAALAAAPALGMAGRAGAAIALVERWQGAARGLSAELPLAAGQLESARVLALHLAGQIRESYARAEAGYRWALAEGTHEGTAVWAMILGAVGLGAGRLATTRRWLAESALLLREFDPVGSLAWTLALLAQAAAQSGEAEAAEAALAEAEAAYRGGLVLDFDLLLARAWAAAGRGELSAARHLALAAAEYALASGQRGFAVLGFHDLARLGDAATAAGRLASLGDQVEGPLVAACATHAAALVAQDPRELERAAASFHSIGAALRAAEATADAARAYRTEGRLARARAADARARILAERTEGARTPALTSLEAADELTAREREIVTLAASGLANRTIADRLVLSVRTVENHLQHAYAKLGVGSRDELARLLRPPE